MKTGKVLDPIHGLIEITEIEEFIINQKIFGRLRKVKQNTLLNYIFPGANHTRFEHSIGVMHLAEKIFNKSNENVETTHLKGQKYNRSKGYITIKELAKDNDHFETKLQELRIAALLHDVGHGPTSHKFDSFTITGKELLAFLEKSIYHKNFLSEIREYVSKNQLQNRKIEHELVSCIFIIKIIYTLKENKNFTDFSRKIIDGIEVKNILKMIDPEFLPQHEIVLGDKNCTNYFNSIIAGFPFDADRMDYLYRDSFYSGVKYGFFDQSRILMSLLPVEHEGKITLGVKTSGLDSVIRFIQSRNHLYNQVYFHKTNSATNSMLDFVFRHMSNQSVFENVSSYEEFEEFYFRNGDEYFLNSTMKYKLTTNGCDVCNEGCVENDVLDELLERNLWKKTFESRINIKFSDSELRNVTNISELEYQLKKKIETNYFDSSKLEQFKTQLECEDIYVQENYSSNIGLKGASKSKMVLIEKEDGNKTTNLWNKINDEMFFLSQTNVFIKRIYVRRTFKNAEEFIEIEKRIKECMIELAL
ncbi:HD domain-containing protein [Marnyiella aurantia]|uniref:HD domain-containing protein n=1 Tax=Marnyiella aurantia TaxID=2758037 RepID=A0A7D7RM08_9FLAO|nr:HD domain-containing protein [Marnyiella aurantia]MBA5247871.1 HD domain-containing protein [Marnyiella aurantia]QMS99492.1 HD domain-containing protein [Marnyiella aurantia]